MSPSTPSNRLPNSITSLLARLRRAVRCYVWVQGILLLVAWLGCAFWISLAIDWLLEPPIVVRQAMLVVAGLVGAVVIYRYVLRRTFVRLTDRNMATLLERRFDRFDDGLLTAVSLADSPERTEAFNEEMLAYTSGGAQHAAHGVNLRSIFDFRPLVRALTAVVVLAGSVIGFAITCESAFDTWVDRAVHMSDDLWPRETRILVEGFDESGVRKIAKGSDFQLVVKADTTMVVPETVTLRYRTDDGARNKSYMNRRGIAVAGRDQYQDYTFAFERLHRSLNLDVHGGDARRRDLRLEVVDSPTINAMTLACRRPQYMVTDGWPKEEQLPAAGVVEVALGTTIVVHAQANKDLVKVVVEKLTGEQREPVATLRPSSSNDRKQFKLEFGRLLEDTVLLFTLTDTDGITGRDPVRLALSAVPDDPPQVAVRLRGIGSAIVPDARLPVTGKISDYYGVKDAWFEYHVGDAEPTRAPLKFGASGSVSDKTAALDARLFEPRLQPGQTLHVVTRASDAFDVTDKPNVGSGERYQLEVVSLDQLRVMLDAREIMFRRRLETIIHELSETRHSLAALVFAKQESEHSGKEPAAPEDNSEDAEKVETKTEPAGPPPPTLAQRLAKLERTLQNTDRSAHETGELAESFFDLAAEYRNNRIRDTRLQERLTVRIAGRLNEMGNKAFAEVDAQVRRLQKIADDAEQATTLQSESVAALDMILVDMNQVLNEVQDVARLSDLLVTLRSLIELQGELNGLTEKEKSKKARSLLDDLDDLEN
jgi:hypothetical protein